jgi:glutathione synthase/RimK-type ligase-like ATP-grasp enzyme
MGDLEQNTIVYMTKLIHSEDATFVKFVGEANRQFRYSLWEMVHVLASEGVSLVFAEIDDLSAEAHIMAIYRLQAITEHSLEFKREACDFVPKVIFNRLKDELYTHAAYNLLLERNVRVINNKEVASLGDKRVSQQLLGDFMPVSAYISSIDAHERHDAITKFVQEHGMTVAKPQRLNGADGLVFIQNESDREAIDGITNDEQGYVLQEFIETNRGIPAFVKGRHDLRIFVCGGKMIAGALRQPKEGSLVSNTVKEGTIQFYSLEQLPMGVLEYCQKIIDQLPLSPHTFVSLDFFYGNNRWYLIEVNDQPGTPAMYQNKTVATTIQNSRMIMFKDSLK